MKALSLYPYYQKRGQCEFTLTSLRLWQQHCSLLREKKEATYGEREQEEERNHSCFVSIDAACLPPHVVVIVSWRSQSGSWVLSVFACHLVSCGGVKENQRSTMHITGGSWGPSVSMSRKTPNPNTPKNKQNQEWQLRTEDEESPICLYWELYYLMLPKHERALIFEELDMGSHIFPLTFSSVCLKSRHWNSSSAALFPAHLEGIQLYGWTYVSQASNQASYASVLYFPTSDQSVQHDLYSELVFHLTLQDCAPASFFTLDFFPLRLLCLPATLLDPAGDRCLRWDARVSATFLNSLISLGNHTLPSFFSSVLPRLFTPFERYEAQRES